MSASPVAIPAAVSTEAISRPSPTRRRRRRGFAGLLFSICMVAVWPMLFLLPAGAIALSWWLGVM